MLEIQGGVCTRREKITVNHILTYSPIHSKRVAFTLAETLITLGIIGIVAALTISSLISQYQKISTVQKLKKNYAMFVQIMRASVDDNGDFDSWDYSTTSEEFAQKYILPYMTGVTKAKSYKVHVVNNTTDALGNFESSWSAKYSMLDGINFAVIIYNEDTWNYSPLLLTVDLNGYSGPNKYGRDVFVYSISRNKPRVFDLDSYCIGWVNCARPTSRELTLNNGDNSGCKKGNNTRSYYIGRSCGYLIKLDGWKISKDYPW
ncbi:type II secretion system protein [bacterium]|nr:type II secretion system protein [bacterium]